MPPKCEDGDCCLPTSFTYNFKCGICCSVFHTREEKTRHNLLHFIPCTMCRETLRSRDHLLHHLKTVHEQKDLTHVKRHANNCKTYNLPVIPRPWWCWDVILGFVFQYKMMSLIPLQCNALNPDPFLRFSFQRNWSPYKGVEGLHSFTLAWLSKMRRDSINLNQTLIRQRKLFINSICQILWRPDHKVLAKMAILTETLLRFSGFFFLKGQTRAKNVWKSKIWSLY